MHFTSASGEMEQVTVSNFDLCHLKLGFADSWLHRDSDITMLAMSNSQERDQNDWEELLGAAHPMLKLEEVRRISDAKLDLIIARWEGDT